MLISSSKLEYWKTILKHPRSITIRRLSEALGDSLLMSALVREIKKEDPKRFIIIETNRPELFEHNPNVDAIFTSLVAIKYHRVRYTISPVISEHVIDQMVKKLPFRISNWERRLDLYFPENAMDGLLKDMPERYVVVNPCGKQKHAANRKEWGFHNYQEVRSRFSQLDFVQVGDPDAPLLSDTIDRRGQSVMEDAYLIKHATTGIFLEGGLMHVSNAVNKPSIIIFGGIFHPEMTGYDLHTNIHTSPHCSPCFTSEKAMAECDTMECMKMVTVDCVADALNRILNRP